MQELAGRFLPVADEVGRLQRGTDPECALFRTMAEQGHYRGRTEPTNTRQGIYALAPSGAFLASCNTRDPRRVAQMLRDALERWRTLPERERYDPESLAAVANVVRYEDRYPETGLVLRVTSRDLPRPPGSAVPKGWVQHAWNRDYAWFTAAEARSLVPDAPGVGTRQPWPEPLALRLARCHLIDNVRGQTTSHKREHVQRAAIHGDVVTVDADTVELALAGEVVIEARGRWSVGGFADQGKPGEQTLGCKVRLAGSARFDRRTQRFVAFDLVAAGVRHGGTQFNNRTQDLEPNPIGYCFELAASHERVPPASIWVYDQPEFTRK